MEIKEYDSYQETEVMSLYASVGWTAYTRSPAMLKAAFAGSMLVLGAFCEGKLVGLIRIVGDGASIVYVQDILVRPEYQCRGIGKRLLQTVMERFTHVYQMVLLTDETPKTISFYRSCGFTMAADMGCCGFIALTK